MRDAAEALKAWPAPALMLFRINHGQSDMPGRVGSELFVWYRPPGRCAALARPSRSLPSLLRPPPLRYGAPAGATSLRSVFPPLGRLGRSAPLRSATLPLLRSRLAAVTAYFFDHRGPLAGTCFSTAQRRSFFVAVRRRTSLLVTVSDRSTSTAGTRRR